ncbi:MAG: energy-coupling factor transporter transmembrane protein EcfT [Lachnospiraceae bacterium]|nr:energy-coupling factor transporter transmembrane protein EcfT [Lachnospiraceae bacterium]
MTGLRDLSTFASYHPIINFSYFVLVIGISMTSLNPWFLACSFASAFAYTIILKGKKVVKFNILFIIPLVLISALLNMFFIHDGETILFYMYENAVTLEALLYGFVIGFMLSGMMLWLMCYQEIVTSDKFIYLFGRILPTLALTISMIFRYIPLLRKRFVEITEGQRCMGRDFKSGSLIKRLHQAAKEVSILIAWSLEASIETSDSMEARGYGIMGRSSFNLFVFTKNDAKLLAIIAGLGALVLAGMFMGKTTIYYYPATFFLDQDIISYITYFLYLCLLVLPIVVDIGGELRWRQLRLKM